MNDRELLEFAAKAAGKLHLIPYKKEWLTDPLCEAWNPLTDDGDALRLAVTLKIGLLLDESESGSAHARQMWANIEKGERYCDDKYSATRRAIVRAAAEIGKEDDEYRHNDTSWA